MTLSSQFQATEVNWTLQAEPALQDQVTHRQGKSETFYYYH